MIKQHIAQCLLQAVEKLCQQEEFAALSAAGVTLENIQITPSREPSLGDYSSNLAMRLAKPTGAKPREFAEALLGAMPNSQLLRDSNVAGPGFLNFFVRSDTSAEIISTVLRLGDDFGRLPATEKRVSVEFVSANPTGPLHVGHGRGAAYGDCIANLLEATGYQVEREYYVNDAGRQMNILALSVWQQYLKLRGESLTLPAKAYQGDYIGIYAAALNQQYGDRFHCDLDQPPADVPAEDNENGDQVLDALIADMYVRLSEENAHLIRDFSRDRILGEIRAELDSFGVKIDRWFNESSIAGETTENTLSRLVEASHTEEREGALWFLSSRFGDRQDRVLRRSNGQLTYFATDIAYHLDKFERGYEQIIDVWGADHHGYVARVKAAIQALGLDAERFRVELVQLVRLCRGSEQLPMSTRSGAFVSLQQLREETGNDAARFFYIMRRIEQSTDFDLELAKARNRDNPVYHIQYAHARTAGVLRQLQQQQLTWDTGQGLQELGRLNPEEIRNLIRLLNNYPDLIRSAAEHRAPHQVANYLRELASAFHIWYDRNRILIEDVELRNARLCLALAVRQVLKNGLSLLGVGAPDKM